MRDAARYADALIEKRISDDAQPDLSVITVPRTWAQAWYLDASRLEDELNVLICLEEPQGKKVSRVQGHLIEASWEGAWHDALVTGVPKLGRVTVKWLAHNSPGQSLPLASLRPAARIGVYGTARNRLSAEMRIMEAVEGKVPGAIAPQLSARRPGGFGLEVAEYRLPWWRKRALLWTGGDWSQSNMGNDLLRLQMAAGCEAILLFLQRDYYNMERDGDQYVVLLVGTRDQRWRAAQLLSFWDACQAQRGSNQSLPPSLAGETCRVKIPKEVMGAVIGKRFSTMTGMMRDFGCFITTMRQVEAESKVEATEDDDFLELSLRNLRNGAGTEMGIFGSPRARIAARIKLMSIIEDAYVGFHPEAPAKYEVEETEGLGVDKVWLDAPLEETSDVSKVRAALLSDASGCAVASAGKLVLLAGDLVERRRAKEYLEWMVLARKKVVPYVADADSRPDMRTIKVTLTEKELMKKSLRLDL